jgi:ABC-type uncharacterized transport system fused permease/ATPase subunit
MIAIPGSLVNSSLDYITHKLSIEFRASLTKYYSYKYLNSLENFKMIYIDRQLTHDILTEQIDMFSTCLSNLISNVTKPVLDILLLCTKLYLMLGYRGPVIVLTWYSLSGLVLNFLNYPVSKMSKVVHKLQEYYKTSHSSLLEYSEEISFLKGLDWERTQLDRLREDLLDNSTKLIDKKFVMKTINSIISKYGGLIIAQLVMSYSVFTFDEKNVSALSKDYIKTSSYFVNISKATTRFRIATKNIKSLAINTHKLSQAMENIHQVALMDFPEVAGKYVTSPFIKFQDVTIKTPDGQLLFDKMSFLIDKGMHTIIQGPHGSGKSSILKILTKLWPLYAGTVHCPCRSEFFYITNLPYLPYGTLGSQFSYPKVPEDLQLINSIIQLTKLDKVLKKYDLNDIQDWSSLLSLKHQQLLGLGRLIYHKPKFIVLDECTTAISTEQEIEIYSYLKSIGITIITISERESVIKYHNNILKLHEQGWNYYRVSYD